MMSHSDDLEGLEITAPRLVEVRDFDAVQAEERRSIR
jgi:hypothetical protein